MIMRRSMRGWAAALIGVGALATETGALSTYDQVPLVGRSARMSAQSAAQRGTRPARRLVPDAVRKSNIEVRVNFVGRIPTYANPTSPVAVGSQLLLIDQSGYIYRWDGTSVHGLLTPTSTLADITLTGSESVLNVAADATGSILYVMFTAANAPADVPQRLSPRPGADAWQVLYQYAFDGTQLSNPKAITALQVRLAGHTGGGLAVLPDGSLLFATGDNGDAFEDGRSYGQDATNHLSKVLQIDPTDGSVAVVAMGVRNPQRLAIYGEGTAGRLDFIDLGGSLAEELNSIPISRLLASGSPQNFGWGRHPVDAQAREGTFYIEPGGAATGAAPIPESGFLQPAAQFGREGAVLIGASGPVSSPVSFSKITSLFGDLVSGSVYATTGALTLTPQDVFRVNLVDQNRQPVTLAGLTGGQRPDPRFFNFPDGTAGVLLERTGNFYRLTQTR
jgi:glucose/sorbosone dehydrogenase